MDVTAAIGLVTDNERGNWIRLRQTSFYFSAGVLHLFRSFLLLLFFYIHIILISFFFPALSPIFPPGRRSSLGALSGHKWSLIACNGDELIVGRSESMGDCFLLYTAGFGAGGRP